MNSIRLAWLAVTLTLVAGAKQNAAVAITHIEGKVYLDEKVVETPAVLSGDGVVRTEGGLAEIQLRNGTVFLGENSSLQVFNNRPYNFNRLLMLAGAAVIATGDGAGLVTCEDTATLSDAGVFRLDLRQGSCRFRVYQGAASVQLASVATVLRTGKTMNLSRECGDMIPWNDFDLKDIDDLDRWSGASQK